MYKYQFTVFTCCYNGVHTIDRVIESLKRQTFKNFEWIIVNNGSTDNLDEIIKPLIAENPFPIKYLTQTPNNFNMANNLGVDNAEGEFFLILDADDAIVDNALEIFYNTYQSLSEKLKHEIAGVVCNCMDQHGNLVGSFFPMEKTADKMLMSNDFEMRYKYKVKGEKYGFIKTDIKKEFPYNTSIDKFYPTNVIWFAIASKYKSIYINEILRIYYINDGNYHATTHEKKLFSAGNAFYFEEVINKYSDKMHLSFIGILKNYIQLIRCSIRANRKMPNTIQRLNKVHKRVLAYLCVPLGYLVYIIKGK